MADIDPLGENLRTAFGTPESVLAQMLGQIRDNTKRAADQLDKVSDKVDRTHERVIALEERNRRQDAIETKADSNTKRIDALESVNDMRSGKPEMGRLIREWWAVISGLALVVWLLGRGLGFIHIPSDEPQTIIPRATVRVVGNTQETQ